MILAIIKRKFRPNVEREYQVTKHLNEYRNQIELRHQRRII